MKAFSSHPAYRTVQRGEGISITHPGPFRYEVLDRNGKSLGRRYLFGSANDLALGAVLAAREGREPVRSFSSTVRFGEPEEG